MLMSLLLAASLAQATQVFVFDLDAPAAEALPLFGPVREAEWAPGWAPHFLHPPEGGQRDGVVFTTTVGKAERRQIWVLTEYDAAAGRVSYVVTEPGFMVTEIRIAVVGAGTGCRATVTYRRSALDPNANAIVESLDARWAAAQGPHWAAAIDGALRRARR